MNPLAGFSDWVLALLPRLFLYPGGTGILVALLIALLVRRTIRRSANTSLAYDALSLLAKANVLPLALALSGLALLALPFTDPLPSPIDRFALAVIIVASLMFDLVVDREGGYGEIWPTAAIVLALMSSLPAESGLVVAERQGLFIETLLEGAVLIGLVGLFGSAHDSWSAMSRLLAWWGVALTVRVLSSEVWGLLTLPAALTIGWMVWRRGWSSYATALAYLLALLSLLTALLLPPG